MFQGCSIAADALDATDNDATSPLMGCVNPMKPLVSRSTLIQWDKWANPILLNHPNEDLSDFCSSFLKQIFNNNVIEKRNLTGNLEKFLVSCLYSYIITRFKYFV